MKKVIALVVLLCGFMPVLWAADGCDQHLSREEFRAKQKAFIIEQAGLSKQEAAKFFPVYFELQDKARNVGFDWEEREQVWDKVKEEIGEFQEEVANMDKDKAEAEFGDVMFSLINAARLYKINPDNALERTNQKFIRRFNYLEKHTIKEGKNLKDMSLEEMDAIWNEAKKKGL